MGGMGLASRPEVKLWQAGSAGGDASLSVLVHGETDGLVKLVADDDTGELLGSMAEVGADVVGVDWRVPIDVARARLGDDRRVAALRGAARGFVARCGVGLRLRARGRNPRQRRHRQAGRSSRVG